MHHLRITAQVHAPGQRWSNHLVWTPWICLPLSKLLVSYYLTWQWTGWPTTAARLRAAKVSKSRLPRSSFPVFLPLYLLSMQEALRRFSDWKAGCSISQEWGRMDLLLVYLSGPWGQVGSVPLGENSDSLAPSKKRHLCFGVEATISEQLNLLKGILAYNRQFGTRWSLMSLSSPAVLWFWFCIWVCICVW